MAWEGSSEQAVRPLLISKKKFVQFLIDEVQQHVIEIDRALQLEGQPPIPRKGRRAIRRWNVRIVGVEVVDEEEEGAIR